MQLYNVPRNSRIKIINPEAPPPDGLNPIQGEELNFSHIDGMYSYCTRDNGEVVHLKAWTEVEVI